MKKYLMSGVAAIAFLAAFTSCSKSTDLYDQGAVDERNRQEQEKKDQQKVENVQAAYEKAFQNAFGQPAAGQDWGFGDSNAATRAFTRAKGDYDDYKGNLEPVFPSWSTFSFPADAPASNFDPDLTGIPSYDDCCKTQPNASEWWTPDELVSGVAYIDKVQKVKITGANSGSKLYIKAGTYDFSDTEFNLAEGTEVYLLPGAELTLNNTAASTAKFTLYIANTAKLIANGANGLKLDNSGKVYNHGNIKASSFEVNSKCFLYNVGTMELTGRAHLENQNTAVVNDGTIICGECYIQGSANVQNNAEWTVKGNTVVNSNNASWINNGHWTTQNYNYTAGSHNVINNCFLEVKNDFYMNVSSADSYDFKIDAGGGVLTTNFYGGGATAGPFKITMGARSVFKVTNDCYLDATASAITTYGYGFEGVGVGEENAAVLEAKNVKNHGNPGHGYVAYSGNLYVSAESHFAQGTTGATDGASYILFRGGCSENNIYAPGFNETGKPNITIEETPCNPGFEGTETEPTEVRVICEDLFANSGSDFDFNDLVFDVVFGTNAKIIIRAAGGTLPIYINNGTEIHKLMGNDTPDEKGLLPMLNTGAAAKGLYGVDNVAAKEINLGFAINKRKEIPENITIKVVKDGTEYTLQNNKEAATMICVGTDFEPWMGERDQLKIAYPKFVDFVQTGKPAWNKWYK